MSPARVHTHIIQYPFAKLLHGARLNAYCEMEQELILDVQGFELTTSELFEQNNKVVEHTAGNYVPLRLRFCNVSRLYRDDFFTLLKDLPQENSDRTIVHFLSWRQPEERDIYYRIGLYGLPYRVLYFFAQNVICEKRNEPLQFISMERDWSPAPPMQERLVPHPKHLYQRFGGDPITIQVDGKVRRHQLFIGGVEVQPEQRPHIDAVLNLGEEPSRWVKGQTFHENDRSINKGEGSSGMTGTEIIQEVEWVIERLQKNRRVLVHCVAGMNRSTTICCAVLMLLEGLSAEAALERVREHHPWARPDSYHWLTLRWLEVTNKGRTYGK